MNRKSVFLVTTGLVLLALLSSAQPAVYRPVSAHAPDAALPDLVITDLWVEDDVIQYQIANTGAGSSAGGHVTQLTIDGKTTATDTISASLAAGQRLDRAFHYAYTCLGAEQSIEVKADWTNTIGEENELNNLRSETVRCDSTPPVITTPPSVKDTSTTTATLYWVTDETTSGRIEYSHKAGLYDLTASVTTSATNHSLDLTGLLPGTLYQFRAVAVDARGNSTTSPAAYFTTQPEPDNQQPSLSNATAVSPFSDLLYYQVSAQANDNQAVDRVELYLDDALIGTDYSASAGGQYTFDVLPGNLGLSREQFFSAHNLKSVAYDRFGNLWENQQQFTPIFQAMDGYVDLDFPGDDYHFPIQSDRVLQGTKLTIHASAYQYGIDLCVRPDLFGCQQITHPVEKVEFFINGVLKQTMVTDPANPYEFTYQWDMSGLWKGVYTIQARAFATDGSMLSETHSVTIEQAVAQLSARRTVHHHGAGFLVQLELENHGSAPTEIFEIKDRLSGFQPAAQEPNEAYALSFAYHPDTQDTEVMISYQSPGIYPYHLEPGDSLAVEYWVVPVLYPGTVGSPGFAPSFGYEIGSAPLWVSHGWWDAARENTFDLRVTRTAESELLSDAITSIHQSSDYLIVTNPDHLIALTAPDSDLIEAILSKAAGLALAKGASLAYATGWGNVDDVDAVVEQWGANMTSASGAANEWLDDGYLLLIGENDVVPAGNYIVSSWWYDDFNVPLADAAYANTSGDSIDPELMVGRVIGDPWTVNHALETLMRMARGDSGYSFSRRDALVVSGFPETRDGGSDHSDFYAQAEAIAYLLDNSGTTVTHLNTPDYPDSLTSLGQLFSFAADKDIIHLAGHGSPWSLDDITQDYLRQQNDRFATAHPFVYGSSCLTGRYAGESYGYSIANGLAEDFLKQGAAAYFGSTDFSYSSANRAMAELFYEHWTPGRSLGAAIKETKIEASGHCEDLWSIEYLLYGDPELGVITGSLSAADAAPAANPAEVASTLEVTVPQFTTTQDAQGNTEVKIPGGSWVMTEDEPALPNYPVTYTVPAGQRVQNVTLVSQAGLQTGSGLIIPFIQAQFDGVEPSPSSETQATEGWWPAQPFDWDVQENSDGSSSLRITIYPFRYNALTTAYQFFSDYAFVVDLTASSVDLWEATTDRAAYAEGDPVTLDVWVRNSGAGQDITLEATVRSHGTEAMVGGFPLRELTSLSGLGTLTLQWDSTGTPSGDYAIQVLARDASGNVLDTLTTDIHIGITALETGALTVTPAVFYPGNPVQIAFQVSNTGTVEANGTAIIRVVNAGQGVVAEYYQPTSTLAPGEQLAISQAWDTTDQPAAIYQIVAYVDYASTTTPPLIGKARTHLMEYLPLMRK